jgi:hypothetical membrane protein
VTSAARLLLAFAPAPFVVATVVASAWTPGHSHRTDFVSELGQVGAPFAWVLALGQLASGGALVGAVALGRRHLPGGPVVALVLAVVAAALSVAAAAPCSPRCPIVLLDAGATPSDAVHNAAASLALVAVVAGAAWSARGPASGWTRFSAATTLAVAGLSGLFFLVVAARARAVLGVTERALFAVIAAWVTGLAWAPVTSHGGR